MRTQLSFQIFLIPFYLILFGVCSILVSGQCQSDQQSILIQLKKKLQFNSSFSTKLVSWNPNSADCCTWGGVTCSSKGQVVCLDLSKETISGGIDDFSVLFGLANLTTLDLSFNNLSIKTNSNISSLSHLPMFFSLKLASCNLQEFPNLQNQSRLMNLDLSSNKIGGEIPSWIWSIGDGSLSYMNLSYNQLTSLQKPYRFSDLSVLDLRFNKLSGEIPIPPATATFIDYSNNLFDSNLPESIGISLGYAIFFSVSNNLLTGMIPNALCNASYLKVLDLSNNHLTGSIPPCLFEFGGSLGVLNLGNNNLNGRIEGTFPSSCGLNTLDLHGNRLEGKIPRSLVNCTMLEVLNLGNNRINDTYPCSLGNNTNLRVLVLRSNSFHGSMGCGKGAPNNWQKLQILDIALNRFSGAVPADCFLQWGAMMTDEQSSKKHLSFTVLQLNEIYYQDTVTVTVKGQELELVKILSLFTSIDISSNSFSGEIPSTIGQLKALYLLNVSRNEFTGFIPPSIGDLRELEALDMSSNKLTGKIPSVLTSLSFLSAFNLSDNQLEGTIPTGSQFQTFTESSYKGNKRLCGFPLTRKCPSSVVPVPKIVTNSKESSWLDIFYGMGVGAGSLTVIAILFSLRRGDTSGTRRQTNLSR